MLDDPMLSNGHQGSLLGESLVRLQIITNDQLLIALYEQQHSKRLLGEELLHLGFVEEKPLLSLLALRFNLPILIDELKEIDSVALASITEEEIRQYQIFPILFDPITQHLTIAASVVHDESVFDRLRQHYTLTCFLTSHRCIQEAFHRFYLPNTLIQLEEELERGASQALGEDTSIIIRLVDALLIEAVRLKASDLHCEPDIAWINLRYRIDGVLTPPKRLHRRHWSALSVRLKLMAGMDIAETRANQDGRITFTFAAREVNCRVSIVPTFHGENIVIRFLDCSVHRLTLDGLGFTDSQQQLVNAILGRPYGITLVVGPTGSGKTTTLYTLLQRFNCHTHNIMTLEDPVEYRLPGIRQINLHGSVKMDFANGVRALLRQAPDILLIGEIRDKETAVAAFQAGMTGHRVLASVHAKSAMGAVARLVELGTPSGHIAANVAGVIGQRLVRRLCENCRTKTAKVTRASWQAHGCAGCGYRGYKGRIVVSEVVYMDASLAALVQASASEGELHIYQQQSGISSIANDAYEKLKAGITSYEEIVRVLDPEREGSHAF